MRNVTSLTDKPYVSPPSRFKHQRLTDNGFFCRSVSGHFSAGDAFSDGSPSDFSCVGKTSVPLVPLFRFVPFSGSLPIFCPFTAQVLSNFIVQPLEADLFSSSAYSEAIGSCRVTMTMTTQPPLTRGLGISSPSASSFTSSSNGSRSALDAAPVVGSRIGFVITVDDVKVRPPATLEAWRRTLTDWLRAGNHFPRLRPNSPPDPAVVLHRYLP